MAVKRKEEKREEKKKDSGNAGVFKDYSILLIHSQKNEGCPLN